MSDDAAESLWARHHAAWRDPAQVVSQWDAAEAVNPSLFERRVSGQWWSVLAEAGITLLVTREYEHLVMAMAVVDGRPFETFMTLPHPSGLVVDRARGRVMVASTRNPNQVYALSPVAGALPRGDLPGPISPGQPLVPTQSWFYPGCLYMHDLAMIGGQLHANAVGLNAVVTLGDDGSAAPVWWPRKAERDGRLVSELNHLQLNSIAAGNDLAHSFFSASTDHISTRRPGHRNFPVDRRGVIFDGATREVMCRRLTRPHSARLGLDRLWVDNSGYGEVGFVDDGAFRPAISLPGWTRGLCIRGTIGFVGTSRVMPRFRQYAPGLKVEESRCALHAVDLVRGTILGSLEWTAGNQIFAIDWLPTTVTTGFPFHCRGQRASIREKALFYSFSLEQRDAVGVPRRQGDDDGQ